MKHLLQALLAALVLCALGWGVASAGPPTVEPPPTATPGATDLVAPPVAIVATELGAGRSDLHWIGVRPTGTPGGTSPPLSSFTHLAEGNVRAEVVPGSDWVVATAPSSPGRDVSFNGALVALRPGAEPVELCGDVVHASRPLVTAEGRVFVARGRAGPWPHDPAIYRVDELTVDEVDPDSGSVRRVIAYQGYLLHLAGWRNAELFLYRLGPGGADLVAVHVDTGVTRPLLDGLLPFARDFSVDRQGARLVFRGRHETDSRRWTIEELDLDSRGLRRLHSGPTFATSPHVWPGGGVAFNPHRRGWSLLGSADQVVAPLGPGVDLLRGVTEDQRFVVALHTATDELGVPFLLDRRTGAVGRLAAPEGRRIAIAGFVEGAPAEEAAP